MCEEGLDEDWRSERSSARGDFAAATCPISDVKSGAGAGAETGGVGKVSMLGRSGSGIIVSGSNCGWIPLSALQEVGSSRERNRS
jgi:hypothetical protein